MNELLKQLILRFEVFMLVKVRIVLLWVVIPCSILGGYQCFKNVTRQVAGIKILYVHHRLALFHL